MKIKVILAAFFVLFGIEAYSQTWVSGFNGTGNGDDQVTAMCSDGSGNVYVTGFSMSASSGYDIVTIKYDSAGDTAWTRKYNGSANSEDKAFGIVIDGEYIYVGGYATISGGNQEDIVLIKYKTSGTHVWTKTYNSASGTSDKAFGIVVDNTAGDIHPAIYLTGYSKSGNNYDYRTLKYDSDGNLQWSKSYNGGTNTEDQAWGIVVDVEGNVIVTGHSQTSSSASFDYYTIKYNSGGSVLWSKRYNGPANGNDRAFGLVVDEIENVTVTGYSANNTSGNTDSYDIATIQYDKEGNIKWTKIYNGSENLEDRPFGIVIDDLNNIYITGSTRKALTSKDIVTIKYTSAGSQSWAAVTNSGANYTDIPYGISISPNGSHIYVAGSSFNGASESPFLVKYNSSGSVLSSMIYPVSGRVACVHVSNGNDLFLGGFRVVESENSAVNNDFISMEFGGGVINLVGISGNNNEVPGEYKLFQNYPNPFNPVTTVKIHMPETGIAKLSVYDISGREIGVLVDKQLSAGSYEVTFDAAMLASGVYFYKLVTGGFTDIKKMMLVK